jgi:hypothetical protein
MKQIVQYKNYPCMTVHLSSWFPLCGQGLFLFGIAFVKLVRYQNSKMIYWNDTTDVVKHEYSHFVQWKKCKIKFIWSIIRDYIFLFWISHDKKQIEKEANEIKASL